MNYHHLPDWNLVEKSTQISHQVPLSLEQKRLSGSRRNGLIWRNGQLVIGSQSHKEEYNCYIQEEEATLWQHHPIDESIQKELSHFCDKPAVESVPMRSFNVSNENVSNFSIFSTQKKGCRSVEMDQRKEEEKEASVVTMGFSHCDSNQLSNKTKQYNVLDFHDKSSMSKKGKDGTYQATFSSSCGKSSESLDGISKQTSTKQNHKRKERYVDEFGWLSEDAEDEVVTDQGRKPSSRSNSGKRSRAAEFHNLSERKRRDRINKKMLALQELVPHCNKTDKATMLDEAIDYLKSLQLQVQIMWMGSGMAPMRYSGFEHLMPRMGMVMNNGPMVNSALASSVASSSEWKYSFQNLFGERNQIHNGHQTFSGSFQSMPLGQRGQLQPSATNRTGVQYDKLMHNYQFSN